MEEKTSPRAAAQIGIGVIAVLLAVISFFSFDEKLLAVGFLFLGGGNLLSGVTNGNTDKSVEGKRTSYIAAAFMLIFAAITIYRSFLKQ